MLRLGAQDYHDLGRAESFVDTGFPCGGGLAVQCDRGIEDLEAFFIEELIEILCQRGVRSLPAVAVCFLATENHIIGGFFFRKGEDLFLLLLYDFGFGLVEGLAGRVGILYGRAVVGIVQDRGRLTAVDRGDPFLGCPILFIYNAVTAQHQRPVGLCICSVLEEDLTVELHGSVKVLISAEMIGLSVESGDAVVGELW